MEEEKLKKIYNTNNCDDNIYTKECNNLLLQMEKKETLELEEKSFNDLYPNLNDKEFNLRIAEKKEFTNTEYDGTIHKNFKEYSDFLSNLDFELANHQIFVKNFLSFQTPYNSLLLYHSLGTGKTCSSIGICEEYRDYLRQMGINKRIIIVASPNVQDNFKLQLFDERKLTLVDGIWNIRACTGNKFLKEINPTSMKGLTREKVISQVKSLLNTFYLFMGYIEFSNYIEKVQGTRNKNNLEVISEKSKRRNLQTEFNNRLIVIDEVHNIRYSSFTNQQIEKENDKNKRVVENFTKLVLFSNNLKLLFLSATPMYNSQKEIIWILNIMNINDRRSVINTNNIFDTNGNLKVDEDGNEIGKEMLIRKSTGYISYVRGENPYLFPFRIYPNEFDLENTFIDIDKEYPLYQLNGKKIEDKDKLKFISVYLTKIGEYQNIGYSYIINNLKKYNNFDKMEKFGYTLLQIPIEALNIVYPVDNLEEIIISKVEEPNEEDDDMISFIETLSSSEISSNTSSELLGGNSNISSKSSTKSSKDKTIRFDSDISNTSDLIIEQNNLTGKKGLKNIMNFNDSKTPPLKGDFEYKEKTLTKYGRIFSRSEIGKYSSKIKTICNSIISEDGVVSEGIILIYSQYIDGGIVPIALALEEMGITRYGETQSLFKKKPIENVDVYTMQPKNNNNTETFHPAKYIMITGDPRLSQNNDLEIKKATNLDNINGEKIKIILISKAGSEGIDLKFVRQIHILEPWYNMNRIEQIIGRGVRNLSHKELPFEKRNVEIFLHGTLLTNKQEEAVDLYVYRVAELKAIQIGKVSRILKENSVDCIINHNQLNFTQENINKILDTPVVQILSSKKIINDYKIGDKPYSSICDYMENCYYNCNSYAKSSILKINENTYNEKFILNNSEKIIQKIKMLMKERFFYTKQELIKRINIPKPYQLEEIYASLTYIIEDKSEYIIDKYGRTGYLINIDEYYLFQPSELNNTDISIYDRSVPLNYKHQSIKFDLNTTAFEKLHNLEEPAVINKEILETKKTDELQNEALNKIKENYDLALKYSSENKTLNRGDDDYYKHAGIILKRMAKDGYDTTLLIGILLNNILDSLLYKDKLSILKYVFQLKIIQKNSIEEKIKQYFENKFIHDKNLIGIFLYNIKDKKEEKKIFILKNNDFIEGEKQDELDLEKIIKTKYINKKYNNIIGFMDYDKTYTSIIFKTKNITKKRNTGFRCSDGKKVDIIKTLNDILEDDKFTKENTKDLIGMDLCIYQNFVLRYFNNIHKNDKIWFFDFEMSKI